MYLINISDRIAELSISLPSSAEFSPGEDTDPDSPMQGIDSQTLNQSSFLSPSTDPEEARLEARELPKFLLARSYFECREFERCAAVFLPPPTSKSLSPKESSDKIDATGPKSTKGKGKDTDPEKGPILPQVNTLPKLSQKSLFLSLYARYLAGEKHKDEESEMILGPADGGSAVNKELVNLSMNLEGWFADRETQCLSDKNQGWLEYLYGIVLAKGKTEDAAQQWLLRSVHRYEWNWGAWLELAELLDDYEEVSESAQCLTAWLLKTV